MAMWIGEIRILLSESIISELTWLSFSTVVNCPDRICHEIRRGDELIKDKVFKRDDQCGEKIQHRAESPCMKETDPSTDVVPISFRHVVGDERDGERQ